MNEDKFTFAYRIIQMNRCEPESPEIMISHCEPNLTNDKVHRHMIDKYRQK